MDVQRLVASAAQCMRNADFRGAIATYEQVLSLAQSVRHDPALAQNIEAGALGGIGSAWMALGDNSQAVRFISLALTISRRIGEPRNIGPALTNLGNAYRGLSNYDEAVKLYNEAVPIIRSLGSKHMEAQLLENIGICHRCQGHYADAREHMERALVTFRQEGSTREGITGQISTLSNLGNIDGDVGQYSTALDRCNEALIIAREYGLVEHEAEIRNNVTAALLQLHRLDDALTSATAAHEAALRAGAKGSQQMALGHKGHIFFGLMKPEEARRAWDSALTLARVLGNRREEAEKLCCLSLHTDHQPGTEPIDLKPALQIAREIDAPPLLARCLFALGKASFHNAAESVATAVEWLQESVKVYGSVWDGLTTDGERLSLADLDDLGVQEAPRLLQQALTRQEQHAEALLVAEAARARAIELILVRQRRNAGRPALLPQRPVSVASAGLESIQQAAVRERTAILFYSIVNESTIYAWVLPSSGSGPIFHSISLEVAKQSADINRLIKLLPTRSRRRGTLGRDLDEAAFADSDDDEHALPEGSSGGEVGASHPTPIRKMTREELSSEIDVLLRWLHTQLIEPLASEIEQEEQLLIIPEGDLFRLPFAALRDAGGRYLIQRHAIRVSPSIGSVAALRSNDQLAGRITGNVLLVGDPCLNYLVHQKTPCPLPGARKEARAIQERLERMHQVATLIEGEEATKDRVLAAMATSEIIHLAMHGDGDSLYLAGNSEAEGRLSLAEVQQLQLPSSRLVVMSACKTFRGALSKDGVLGITRAFLAAGAPTVVASIWPLHDDDTLFLATAFYDELCEGRSVASAMQQAVKRMIAEGHQVHAWAPFVVYGRDDSFFEPVFGESLL